MVVNKIKLLFQPATPHQKNRKKDILLTFFSMAFKPNLKKNKKNYL